MYNFNIKHVPGISHAGPDACSRYPTQSNLAATLLSLVRTHPSSHDEESSYDTASYVESTVIAAMSGNGYSDGIDIRAITLERVKEAATHDAECQQLLKVILDGFPATEGELLPELQPYFKL